MDICMLTPSERAALEEMIEQFERVKGRVLVALENIEQEWVAEVKVRPDTVGNAEDMVLPMARLEQLEKWIEKLNEQTVCLDMDEATTTEEPEAYNLERYSLDCATRAHLQTLITKYNTAVVDVIEFIKPVLFLWEEQYEKEPVKYGNPKVAEEIERRLEVLERWIGYLEPIEKPDISELDRNVE